MYLKELRPGTDANLEIIKDDSGYEISTKVLGSTTNEAGDNITLLAPFLFKGKVLDLGNRFFDQVVYNLYATDPMGVRVCWKGLNIGVIERNGKKIYAASASVSRAQSRQSDRRSSERFRVELDVHLQLISTSEFLHADIYDISADGISFSLSQKRDLIMERCLVEIRDQVNNMEFELHLGCNCVRSWEKDGRFYYGCAITSAGKNYQTYIYYKKLHGHYRPEELNTLLVDETGGK